MGHKIFTLFSSLAAVAMCFQFSSCSLVGLGIGAASDASKPPNKKTVQYPHAIGIKPGTNCSIILKNNEKVTGKFLRIDRLSGNQYAARYANRQQQDSAISILPAPGERVVVKLKTEAQQKVRLLGYDGYLSGYELASIAVNLYGTDGPTFVEWGHIATIIDSAGNSVGTEAISKLISEGRIPLMSELVVRSKKRQFTRVPVDEVNQIEIKSFSGKEVGLLIGAAVDIAAIVAVSIAASKNAFGGF